MKILLTFTGTVNVCTAPVDSNEVELLKAGVAETSVDRSDSIEPVTMETR